MRLVDECWHLVRIHFGVLTVVVGVSVPAVAQEIDPSKPTNLYSFIDFNFEWQGFGQGETVGLRVMPTWAINDQNMVQTEIPIQRADFESIEAATGVGDIRIRYFGLPWYGRRR